MFVLQLPDCNCLIAKVLHSYLAHFAQTENLESAAVRKNRLVPVHELVQTACLLHDVVARSQIEVVRVAQDDLGTHLFNLFRAHGLYCGRSSNRHEYRRLNIAVWRMDYAPPRPRSLVSL